MSILPIEHLRSADLKVNGPAWAAVYPILWGRMMRLLGGGLLSGAEHVHNREEIAAQTMQQVVCGILRKNPPAFNQIDTLDDLLRMTDRILRRRRADFFRHRGRHPEDPTDEIPEQIAPNAKAERMLTREELETLLDRLPPPKPGIMRDHYFAGQTAAEIAEARQMPRNTVLAHLHRGKLQLQRWLLGADEARGSDSELLPLKP